MSALLQPGARFSRMNLKCLEAIQNERTVTVRYKGQTYFKDWELTDDEWQRLIDTWIAYRAMGGK
jgi:hypothetical protein